METATNFFKEVYTTNGRLNRLRYFKYQVILILVAALASMAFVFVGRILTGTTDSVLITVPTGTLSFAASVGHVMLDVRRLHDLNKSGWFWLLLFVPLINIIFMFYMWLAPGTAGYNNYGEDPLANED